MRGGGHVRMMREAYKTGVRCFQPVPGLATKTSRGPTVVFTFDRPVRSADQQASHVSNQFTLEKLSTSAQLAKSGEIGLG